MVVLHSPADSLLPFVSLFADVSVFLNEIPDDAILWCAGRRKPDVIKAIMGTRPKIQPVLIGHDRDELFSERATLGQVSSMGFLRDLERPGWTLGLPYPVHAASLGFYLSSLEDGTRMQCLQELAVSMASGGILVWSDFFLPQRLELQALYLEEYVRWSARDEKQFSNMAQAFSTHHSNPVLLETAITEIYASGFANAEIVSKRLGVAVLMARK
jgi:hypothetical protein